MSMSAWPAQAEPLAQQRQLTWLEPWQPEGLGLRALARDAAGQHVLVYLWSQVEPFERARQAYQPELAGQLFAVPELRWSCAQRLALGLAPVPGVTLRQAMRSDQASSWSLWPPGVALLGQVGVLLRKLHSVPAPPQRFGELGAQGGESKPMRTLSGLIAARLDRAQHELERLGLDEPTHRLMLEGLADLRYELSAFHPRHGATLTHGSLGLDSIWVDAQAQQVVGVTGFDRAAYMPPEADLAWLLWLGLEQDPCEQGIAQLYRGYGAARTMDVQRRERFYRRLSALVELGATSAQPDQRARQIALADPSRR